MESQNPRLRKQLERWAWSMRDRITDFSGEATVKWIVDDLMKAIEEPVEWTRLMEEVDPDLEAIMAAVDRGEVFDERAT